MTAPKLLIERLGMELTDAGYATSLYFLFRTLGCLSGSLILTRIPAMRFFLFSVGLMLLATAGLFCLDGKAAIYVCVALLGFGNSNIFRSSSRGRCSTCRQAERGLGADDHGTDRRHDLPLLMGALSDALGSQNGSVASSDAAHSTCCGYPVNFKQIRNENDQVVGIGEALWDMLPEGKKIGAHRPISPTTSRNSE